MCSVSSIISLKSILSSLIRNEFRAWTDVKPAKAMKAKVPYKPPEARVALETSYNSQFKGECNLHVTSNNKLMERRRIRSLYSEPSKEPTKVRCFLQLVSLHIL